MIAIKNFLREQVRSLSVHDPAPPPRRLDWLWVFVFGAIAVVELILDGGPWKTAQAIAAVLLIGLLPWRRQLAVPMVIGMSGVFLVLDIISDTRNVDFEILGAASIPMAMIVYAMFRWPTVERVALGSIVALVTVILGSLAGEDPPSETLPGIIFWLALGALAVAMRYRAGLIREQKAQVRLTERHDLARELHDTVAHHVSAIAVQAQAARFVASSNPEAAAESMKNVEELASKTIEEMRRMVGILRSDDGDSRSVAASSLKELEDQSGEPPVMVQTDVDMTALPSPVAAALYRIAQESVTNARRHNRGVTFIDVQATSRTDHVELTISNDGTPTTRNSGSGYGLIGMQERVTALEGTFESGPGATGGWRTLVTIPLRGSA